MKKLIAFACLSMTVLPAQAEEAGKPKQLVVISFDGAHDNRLWDRSLALGRKTGAHFTFFLSCTFLMSPAERAAYQGPHQKKARSNTGFAQSSEEVRTRLGNIWQARLEGHEMGSHACGHFDGKDWSKADWAQEFADFDTTLLNAWKENGAAESQPSGWADFVDNDIKGFRAPYLSVGEGLIPALRAGRFRYDASMVSLGPQLPKIEGGLVRFALPRIAEGPAERPVIAMDYNLFVRHSKAQETPEHAGEFAARSLAAFRNAFEKQYLGDRIPLQIGFHFVEMNGGAYWSALEDFATETCGLPEVACVSYGEALDLMSGAKKADPSAF